MPTVEEYRAEFAAALAEMSDEREGFDDMARTNIVKAREGVTAQITAYERRRLLLVAAEQARARFETALRNLHADGYPAREPLVLSDDALADLDEQQRTWNKARAKFVAAEQADHVEITAGAVEEQP